YGRYDHVRLRTACNGAADQRRSEHPDSVYDLDDDPCQHVTGCRAVWPEPCAARQSRVSLCAAAGGALAGDHATANPIDRAEFWTGGHLAVGLAGRAVG